MSRVKARFHTSQCVLVSVAEPANSLTLPSPLEVEQQ